MSAFEGNCSSGSASGGHVARASDEVEVVDDHGDYLGCERSAWIADDVQVPHVERVLVQAHP